MIGSNYKAHKDNVIDMYDSYLRNRAEFNSSMESKEGDGINLNHLQSRMDNLKNDKFILAVAGEVKSGKSTFINALLGTELLPSDVLQATSAIIEIFKSERPYLKIKYADGREEEIYYDLDTLDVNKAQEKLNEICKISDKFRGIPTTLIEEYIAASDTPIQLSEDLIKKWESESSLNGLLDKKQLLNDYIAERSKDCIPREIQLGYPLKWNFDELRIVDTPGVNAVGGVQGISFSYLENANAILFIHPIAPIESESFSKFVTNTISNRSRDTLFLILTHSALHTETEIERLYDEAIRIYSQSIPNNQSIPKERILVIDSILELIVHDFKNGKAQEEIEESEQKADIMAKFEKRAKKIGKSLLEILEDSSGFKKMYEAINSFSMIAPNQQLREILEYLKDGYTKQEGDYNAKVERLETKKRNPQEFENEINRIKGDLGEYQKSLNDAVDDFKQNYTGINSEWLKKAEILREKYKEQISKCTTIDTVRKSFVDGYNEVITLSNQFSAELTEKVKANLVEINEPFKEEKKITIPRVDISSIENEAKKQAFKIEDVYGERNYDFWDYLGLGIPILLRDNKVKVGEKKVYAIEKHIELFRNESWYEFSKLIDRFYPESKTFLESYLESLSYSFKKVIKDRQDALDNELEKKETNEELIDQINYLRKKKDLLPQETQRINEVLGDLE